MKYLLLSTLCALGFQAVAQNWTGVQLPFVAFPSVTVISVATPDDIYFGAGSNLAKSTDGGATWTNIYTQPQRSFSAIGFSDASNGFACTTTEDAFQTTDGGATWGRLTDAFPIPIFGVDAMQSLGASLFAVGSTTGNDERGYLLRSLDGGQNWTHNELSTNLPITGLADVAFVSQSIGFVSGLSDAGGVIYRSIDGGDTFTKVYDSGQAGESVVDLEFVNANLGFAALSTPSTVSGTARILKTTDGGATWTAKQVSTTNSVLTSVGFLDESRGWVGSAAPMYETTDGGETWTFLTTAPAQVQTIERVSASRMLAGSNIAPRLFEWVDPQSSVGEVGELSHELQVSSTVLTDDFSARIVMANAEDVRLVLMDAAGRERLVFSEGRLQEGVHSFTLPKTLGELPSGAYFLTLQTAKGVRTVSVVR